jgi:hypothetical protein
LIKTKDFLVNPALAVNMGTSVHMIEKHYGHLKPLQAHRELTARYKI